MEDWTECWEKEGQSQGEAMELPLETDATLLVGHDLMVMHRLMKMG